MAKKKKKQMRETLYCPYCKRPGVLRPAAYVYGDNNLDPEKYLYVCSGYPSCDSYIGAHKKSMRPMGTIHYYLPEKNKKAKRVQEIWDLPKKKLSHIIQLETTNFCERKWYVGKK